MSGYFFHDWSNSIVKASNFNKSNNSVSFTDNLPYGLKDNQRFYFFNSLDALDNEGEYYIDYDNCMSSANVYKNKITNVPLAILAGGGRDITIEDNQITNCENSIIFDERGLTWANLSELEERLLKIPYTNKT